jgi:hypothetical protein
MNPATIKSKAQSHLEAKIVAFLAMAMAVAGGKVKTDELLSSGNRFEKNVVQTNADTIQTSTLGEDAVLTYTNEQDRAVLVGGFGFMIDADGASIPDGLIDQINRLVVVEVKRASGSNHNVSMAAHFHGCNGGTPGGYTDDDRFADRMEPLNIPADYDNPVDYLNPGESISFSLTGLNGVTIAESFSDIVNIVGHISTFDLVKG